ncbi:MAG: hypothetical protein ACLVHS_00035 [Blautia wexlerae]
MQRLWIIKFWNCRQKLADAHKETIRVRNYWFQVLEDMLLEFEAMQKKAETGSSRRWRSVSCLPKNKEMML